jgi:glycosyltransferase involved in cell wall biosynthesis
MPLPYAVITPVRNEGKHFARTIASLTEQTWPPSQWIIVDDGSSDDTGRLADVAASRYEWIRVVHRPDRGFREPGSGVVEAFYDGFRLLDQTNWQYLAKLDGDLEFSPEYFQRCIDHFQRDAHLGIAGGLVCRRNGESEAPDSGRDPAFHVRGATKIYRRACWRQIGGLMPVVGWDSIDELKANMLGWRTRTLTDVQVWQLKGTGSADGHWRNWTKNGLANYIAGYHPLFMLLKCLRRLFTRPYGLSALGLAWGYGMAWIKGVSRIQDAALIEFVQKQQLNKLRLRPSLW